MPFNQLVTCEKFLNSYLKPVSVTHAAGVGNSDLPNVVVVQYVSHQPRLLSMLAGVDGRRSSAASEGPEVPHSCHSYLMVNVQLLTTHQCSRKVLQKVDSFQKME